jgi:ParB-like chromosome segregation protein Spo0J
MYWDELCDLATDIGKNGLKEKIKLLEGQILDGRNRYLACLMVGASPDFILLPSTIKAKSYVISMNYHRRHLTKAEKCNFGLEFLREERKKAEKRQKATHFNKNESDKRSNLVGNSSVCTQLPHTDHPKKKGRAMDLAAKKAELGSKTLRKFEKITIAANKSEEIKKELEDINQGKKSIEEVYKKIANEPKEKNILKKEGSQEKILHRDTECTYFRAAACPSCMAQLMACKLDLKTGNLILKKECPKSCSDRQ